MGCCGVGERVSGTPVARQTREFATLLRELKDRSGLSYGALATRLHLSTSTLHRYCNGTAVPNEYAPVERLARVCRATPQELVELHRRWVLADVARRLRREDAAASHGHGEGAETGETDGPPRETGETGVVGAARGPASSRRRRTTLIAAAAAAAVVLGVVVVVAHPPWGVATKPSAAPLAVVTRPYVYDSPCSQHFLVDRAPARVGPPASEQDAPHWAAAYGAVSSGDERVALTVQGTGADTVVLEALHVSVITKGAPLAWNDYSMGVGCGGGVDSKSFDIDLDSGSPTVTVKNGQRDFPYKVSESDPEVFYVTAHTTAADVRWDLTLDWSSGSRHGTVRIDDNGAPFRTSADTNRPGYDYPLGGTAWITRTN